MGFLRDVAKQSGEEDDPEEGEALEVLGLAPATGMRAVRRQVLIDQMVAELTLSPKLRPEELATKLGVSRATVYRIIKEPDFVRAMEEVRRGEIASRVPAALAVLLDLMEDPKASEGSRRGIAKWLLDRHERLTKALGKGAAPEREGSRDRLNAAVAALRAVTGGGAGSPPARNGDGAGDVEEREQDLDH